MSDMMREAFEKAGYKSTERKTQPAGGLGVKAPPTKSAFSLNEDYPAQAEQVIKELKESKGGKFRQFTTSKIRNILAKVSEIYNDVTISQNEVLDNDTQRRITYLKVRLVYECGREPIVKDFVEKAGLLDLIDNIGSNKQNFIDFAHYMEALVAYHLYYDGRDN